MVIHSIEVSSVRNRKKLTLPAVEDIPAYPVRLKDGKIEIGLPPVE